MFRVISPLESNENKITLFEAKTILRRRKLLPVLMDAREPCAPPASLGQLSYRCGGKPTSLSSQPALLGTSATGDISSGSHIALGLFCSSPCPICSSPPPQPQPPCPCGLLLPSAYLSGDRTSTQQAPVVRLSLGRCLPGSHMGPRWVWRFVGECGVPTSLTREGMAGGKSIPDPQISHSPQRRDSLLLLSVLLLQPLLVLSLPPPPAKSQKQWAGGATLSLLTPSGPSLWSWVPLPPAFSGPPHHTPFQPSGLTPWLSCHQHSLPLS